MSPWETIARTDPVQSPECLVMKKESVYQLPHEIVKTVSWVVLKMQMIPLLTNCWSFRLNRYIFWEEAVCHVDHTIGLLCITKDFCLCYPALFQIGSSSFTFLVFWLCSTHIHGTLCGSLVHALLIVIYCFIPVLLSFPSLLVDRSPNQLENCFKLQYRI